MYSCRMIVRDDWTNAQKKATIAEAFSRCFRLAIAEQLEEAESMEEIRTRMLVNMSLKITDEGFDLQPGTRNIIVSIW